MSKYIDALKTARPEHLYVLDLDRTALDAGTVTDLGYNPVNGTVNETGTVGIEPVEPLVAGLDRSLKFNVVHDRQLNDPAEGYGIINIFDSDAYFGPDSENFLIEMVTYVPNYNRSRNGFSSDIGSPLLHLFMNSQHSGFSNYRVDNDNFRFILRLNNSTASEDLFATTPTFSTDEIYHVALHRIGDSFSLYVNGDLVATEQKTLAFDVDPDALRIGGFVSVRHSDSIIQSFASWSTLVSSEGIKERYEKLDFNSDYSLVVDSLSPDASIPVELNGSVGVLEPYINGISGGVNPTELYEDENERLQIQPSQMGAGQVTFSKKLRFDLSGLSAGIRSFLFMSTVVDSNSTLTAHYSFDDVSYSPWSIGEDTIPEINAHWGDAI